MVVVSEFPGKPVKTQIIGPIPGSWFSETWKFAFLTSFQDRSKLPVWGQFEKHVLKAVMIQPPKKGRCLLHPASVLQSQPECVPGWSWELCPPEVRCWCSYLWCDCQPTSQKSPSLGIYYVYAGTLVLNFAPPRMIRKKYLLFSLPSA